MTQWSRANFRHLLGMARFGRNPAARVYESIGDGFVLATAPGWLNLGWWDSGVGEHEAARAPRRLVEHICEPLPHDAAILDVGNGLAQQDIVLRELRAPRLLVPLNITEWQLHAARETLERARAVPVAGDATRLPLADASMDGLISVEAAFHYSSRASFFAEAHRVLRPGGVLTMSDVTVERRPRGARELIAGFLMLRFWGIRARATSSADEISGALAAAGFTDIDLRRCGEYVIDPALEWAGRRLAEARGSRTYRWSGLFMLRQARVLRRRGLLEYVLVRARRP